MEGVAAHLARGVPWDLWCDGACIESRCIGRACSASIVVLPVGAALHSLGGPDRH